MWEFEDYTTQAERDGIVSKNQYKFSYAILIISLTVFACGKLSNNKENQASPGASGTQGTPGEAGLTTLLSIIQADPNVCSSGGYIFSSGLDTSRNGILELQETTSVAIVCNGNTPALPQYTPSLPISPCGLNSSSYKEVLLGLTGGGILAEFTGNNSNAGTVRNTLIPDGSYTNTDDSQCLFSVATDVAGNRTIVWTGQSANSSGPYHPGSATYTALTKVWNITY